ncbi:MAG: hypothetical protein KF752_04545 [Pirellulaceae bacterium]|nr:hypothetical protein [Pirellulaceae bacterium]
MTKQHLAGIVLIASAVWWFHGAPVAAQEIVGMNTVPHSQSAVLRWRRPSDAELAARVELFIQNTTDQPLVLSDVSQIRFDGQSPQQLLAATKWAWHDTPAVWGQETLALPPQGLLAWKINGWSASWGVDTRHDIDLPNGRQLSFVVSSPKAWQSAVTFLSTSADGQLSDNPYPNQLVIHVHNQHLPEMLLRSVRLWTAIPRSQGRVFLPTTEFQQPRYYPTDGRLAGPGKAIIVVDDIQVPREQVVVEVRFQSRTGGTEESLWSTLKVKAEQFDISGGWIASQVGNRHSLACEEYLKTLARMHINTGHFEEVPGYTDNPELYARYPLKRFNRLADLSRYDNDQALPTIHAVEFIGEPQFGGGRPIPPQEVWQMLEPYRSSRLPTSVTLSEERSWRYYAGLSDYPHYDAYRVIAPAADWWRGYEWGDAKIAWGAPLETIGDMTRSLREHSRPMPIAYWSQGAHHGWGNALVPRRGSPTADELRSQAWHALGNRITSLYWFNLSLKSLLKYPDLIEPMTRVGREIRLLDEIFLRGDAFEYRRELHEDRPAWDLCSIATPNAVLLTAHDLTYQPDMQAREFRYQPRAAELRFRLPEWLGADVQVFAADSEGIRDIPQRIENGYAFVSDTVRVVGIYIATADVNLRQQMVKRYSQLIHDEQSLDFDPAHRPQDLRQLELLLK